MRKIAQIFIILNIGIEFNPINELLIQFFAQVEQYLRNFAHVFVFKNAAPFAIYSFSKVLTL